MPTEAQLIFSIRPAARLRALVALGAIATAAAALPALAAPAITVPEGFTAKLVHEGVGPARHIATGPDGTLYVALRKETNGGGTAVLRDTTGDGNYDQTQYAATPAGTGILMHDGHLYRSSNDAVYRYDIKPDGMPDIGSRVTMVSLLPDLGSHAAKPIDIEGDRLFVNVGAPSNACQSPRRTKGAAGQSPCPELQESGGIWSFDATTPDRLFPVDAIREGYGLRHCVAIAVRDRESQLYAVMHGRDQLDSLWPEHYTAEDNANNPAEEFHRINGGRDYGWPYTYWDPQRNERMLAPEYGGNGTTSTADPSFTAPIQSFPAHWAPNGMLFYESEHFPKRYRGGAFVAHHGSWNRAPFPQAGYKVTFTPFAGDGGNSAPSGDWEPFATGFPGSPEIRSPRDAEARPMGLAVDIDGTLLIADSVKGRIWRISHEGNE